MKSGVENRSSHNRINVSLQGVFLLLLAARCHGLDAWIPTLLASIGLAVGFIGCCGHARFVFGQNAFSAKVEAAVFLLTDTVQALDDSARIRR
ncbi:hypothetical protein [Pelagicoccus albus]|uniref:Uncharacterized protein n=1 Tax=Pelagicoccus albus TaxID=415222 RepID=A0A7X1B3J6_9BACT|nr:hypothetical protein [Pelagicoccus albus]MBC2604764.1 hypothetical protein [Pelagicoccus albus]